MRNGQFVVLVRFDVPSENLASFLDLVSTNATASLTEEEGCTRFDVVQAEDAPNRIFLYEVYDDRSAFHRHLATPHFATFDAASQELFSCKDVINGALLNSQ